MVFIRSLLSTSYQDKALPGCKPQATSYKPFALSHFTGMAGILCKNFYGLLTDLSIFPSNFAPQKGIVTGSLIIVVSLIQKSNY